MTITSISAVGGGLSAIVVAAPYAPAGPILAGTSDSTVMVGDTTVHFTMNEFGLGFVPGVRVRCSSQDDPIHHWVEGIVTDYVDNVLTVTVDYWGGGGDPITGWNINVAGLPGQAGAAGTPGPPGPPGGLVQGVLAPFAIDGSNNLVLNHDATLAIVGTQLGVATDAILPGTPSAGVPPTLGDNSNKLATTSFVGTALLGAQPLDADLTAIAALTGINTIYYRSAANTWAAVTIGTGLSFSGGTLASTSVLADGDKGDISITGGVWTIDPQTVTYAKMQNVSATARLLGRVSAGAGSVEELTGTQAATVLPTFGVGANGLVPGPSAIDGTKFLRTDGSWAAPSVSGGALPPDANYGDITVSGTGAVWTIGNAKVTYAKMQATSAASVLLGRGDSGAGAIQELTVGAGLSLTGTTLSAMITGGVFGAVALMSSLNQVGGSVLLGTDQILIGKPGPGYIPAAVTVGGDLTMTNGNFTIANGAVSYAKIQNVSATSRVLGRASAGAGTIEELTGTQITSFLDAFTTTLKGAVPASGGGTTNFLRADGTWASSGFNVSVSNVQTASYTLVLTDAGKTVRMNVSTANTLTIPPNSSVAFPVDTIVAIEQYGSGQTTVTPGSGVTLRIRTTLGAKLVGQYAAASLHKIGTDEWLLAGDIGP